MGAFAPFLLSLAIFPGWDRPLETLALFVVIEVVVSNFVEPFLYGEQTGLSSVAILVSAVFWTTLWGPIGLVLSTPLTVCLVVMGRHVPRLAFLNTLLGDEPVLTPDTHFYQRLLAMDHQEAKEVLESTLKQKTLEELYDTVLIPAMSLAEQDRHSNELDDATEQFICQSTRELIEELFEISNRQQASDAPSGNGHSISEAAASPIVRARFPAKILCLPVRDEADEIVAIMVAQALQRSGHDAQSTSIANAGEMLEEVSRFKPDIICLSALPPFAVQHARSLYGKLRSQSRNYKIVIGLWKFAGDLKQVSKRIGIIQEDAVFTSLTEIVQAASGVTEAEIAAETETVK
jgi:hypothetical protein